MKKTIFVLICVLFVMTILYPAGVLITNSCGYDLELISVSAFVIAIAVLSVGIVVLDRVFKNALENKKIQILLAIMSPLSLISSVFYIFECPQIQVVTSVLISAGCCCFLTIKHGKPMALKIAALILSAIMVLPMSSLTFFVLLFGNIGHNTVVQTVESPNGEYYAQVIDSDQGALGGDTLVDVYKKGGINLILFKIEPKPQRVYWGNWGEFRDMKIHWKDDECLVINSAEYEIE